MIHSVQVIKLSYESICWLYTCMIIYINNIRKTTMTMFFSLMLTLLPTRASFLAEEFSAWITPKKKVFKGIDKQDQHEETLGVIKSSMCFFLLEKEEFSRCVCSYLKLTMIERYCYFVFEYWMNNSNKSSWSKSFNIYYNVYVKSYLSAALIRRWVAKNRFQKGKYSFILTMRMAV